MQSYKDIVNKVLFKGQPKKNRTGIDTMSKFGVMFEHDMSDGFPLLTTKYVPIHLVAAELEFFIKGITDKEWLQKRGCHIWDKWCNPAQIPYDNDYRTKEQMMKVRDLGAIYGFQWRHFGATYFGHTGEAHYGNFGVDQLKNIVNMLKVNPEDRRILVSAWNPMDLHQMALPPCHYSFQINVTNGRLDLLWNQRSVDVALGLPFNIASYGLLLLLLARETGYIPGMLIGSFGDTHIYSNHIDKLTEQVSRSTFDLPRMIVPGFTSIFDWTYDELILKGYQHHPTIKYEIAV